MDGGDHERSPRLDGQLCFALYAASRALTSRYRPVLAPLGLTYPQYLVMLALWEQDGITVGALGARMQLDSGTLSPLLSRMQNAGLLQRDRRQDDERSVRIRLTESGAALAEPARTIPREMAGRLGIGDAEREALREQLLTLADTLAA